MPGVVDNWKKKMTTDEFKPWKRKNPKPKAARKTLTAEQKASAKRRADEAEALSEPDRQHVGRTAATDGKEAAVELVNWADAQQIVLNP